MKKAITVILLLAIVPFLLGSSLDLFCVSDHACTQEDCAICIFASLLNLLTELISGALVAVAILVLTKLKSSEIAAIAHFPASSERTPIRLKVKLSD